MRTLTKTILMLCFVPAVAAAQLTISQPNDIVVNSDRTDVSGKGVPNGTAVTVTANSTTKSGTAAGGTWSVTAMPLVNGDNTIAAKAGSSAAASVAVRSHTLTPRARQRVFFQWDADVDEELRAIARGTLTPVPTVAQLDDFVTRVRARTSQIYTGRFSPFGVEVVTAAGAGVHNVHMTAIADTIFGSSPLDCGNGTAGQTSTIHVGTYRANMVDRFPEWGPMKKTDSLDVRVEDVAQALGRTTTHETGHSLGLVAESGTCAWMNGCDGSHNCDQYDVRQPLANRFDHGRHIMDPGEKTFNRYRLGEPSASARAATRVPSFWEPFGRSYLTIVQPRGP